MSAEGRAERTAAPAGRRSVPPTVVQRTTASIARSPAQALQDRLGFRATQQLIARSPAARVGTTAPTSAQTSKARRLPISSPRDPAEIEAEAVARRVVTMQAPPAPAAPPPVAPTAGAAGVAHRAHHKSSNVSPARTASPMENTGAGAPLPASVRSHMEPRFGAEITPDYFPMEVGLDAAIDYAKGCYLGQEPIVRIRDRGHINWRLVGLDIAGSDDPAALDPIETDAKPKAGRVTSASRLPDGRGVALAMLHTSVPVGATIRIRHGDARIDAQVRAEAVGG